MRTSFRVLLAITLLACFGAVVPAAHATGIYFDDLPDQTYIGSSYAGLGAIFTNATILDIDRSLNPTFPPLSYPGLAYDSGTPIIIDFTVPVHYVDFAFTTNDNLSLWVFDNHGNTLAQFNDFYVGCNYIGCTDSPNIVQFLSSTAQIGEIQLFSDDGPNSFTIDNLHFYNTPEPASLMLMGTALLAAARRLLKRA